MRVNRRGGGRVRDQSHGGADRGASIISCRRAPRRTYRPAMRRAWVCWAILSVTLGACRSIRELGPSPTWNAEPLSLIDLPGEERPTAVRFLGERGFVVSYNLRSQSGARFRTLQGGAWSQPDFGPESNDGAEGLTLSPDGAFVAVAQYDRIQLVPLAGAQARTLSLRAASPGDYCGSPWSLVWGRPGAQGTLAVQCALGRPLTLVDVESGRLTFPPLGPDVAGTGSTLRDLSLSRTGDTLVVVGHTTRYADDDTTAWVELRALPDGAPRQRFTLSRTFGDAALSPDSARLAVSSPYWGLQVLDVASGRVLAELSEPPDRANSGSGDVVWSPDGALLYRVGRRLSISVHDGATAQLRGYFPAHPADARAEGAPGWPSSRSWDNGHLTLSPDGRYLAALSRADVGPSKARAVRIWRLPARGP